MASVGETTNDEAAAVWVPLEQLRAWDQNPRNNAAAVAKVAASIKRFGFGAPIVARAADRQIIAGHTRLMAARKLGLNQVPVRFLNLDPVEARLLSLADNKLGEIAEWNEPELGKILAELKLEDADLLATGFDAKEVDRLLAQLNATALADVVEPPLPETPEVARSVPGEVYELGPHRLMCGDSTKPEDVLKLMAGERSPLCATDPPYLVDYDGTNHPQSFERTQAGKDNNKHWDAYVDPQTGVDFFTRFLRVALDHALTDTPAIYQWHASRRQVLVEQAWTQNHLLLHQQIIWVKPRPVLTRSHYMWQHEPCFYGWIEGRPPRRRPPLGGECSTVWTIDGEHEGIHPTQKPLTIFERPITYHTEANEIVYEPFSGSGSQLIAAARTGRRCYAMELAPEFVDVARIRWTRFAKRCRRRSWARRSCRGARTCRARVMSSRSTKGESASGETIVRGRKPKLTWQVQQQVVQFLRTGATLEAAAGAVGIHRTTLQRWLEKGDHDTRGRYHNFFAEVTKAQSEFEIRSQATILKAAQTDWKAAAWGLERRFPERYGKQFNAGLRTGLEQLLNHLQCVLPAEAFDAVLKSLELAPANAEAPKDRSKIRQQMEEKLQRLADEYEARRDARKSAGSDAAGGG